MCACVHACVCACMHAHVHACVHADVCVHAWARASMGTCAQMRVHVYVYVQSMCNVCVRKVRVNAFNFEFILIL